MSLYICLYIKDLKPSTHNKKSVQLCLIQLVSNLFYSETFVNIRTDDGALCDSQFMWDLRAKWKDIETLNIDSIMINGSPQTHFTSEEN